MSLQAVEESVRDRLARPLAAEDHDLRPVLGGEDQPADLLRGRQGTLRQLLVGEGLKWTRYKPVILLLFWNTRGLRVTGGISGQSWVPLLVMFFIGMTGLSV